MSPYVAVTPQLEPFFHSALILMMGGVWAFVVGFLRRYEIEREKRRRQSWKERWQPILNQAVSHTGDRRAGSSSDPPGSPSDLTLDRVVSEGAVRTTDREREYLVLEWIQYMNQIEPVHHEPLIRLAEAVGLGDKALEMAGDDSNLIRRIKGLRALGFMDHPGAWEKAREAAASDQPYLSIVGAQTLVEIDPHRGLPVMLDEFVHREAFPVSQALVLLKDAPADLVTKHVLEYFWRTEGPRKVRVAQLFEAGDPGVLRSYIHEWIDDGEAPSELIAKLVHVLGAFGHPGDEQRLIKLTRSDEVPIRIQAIKALGELGTSRSAVPLLEGLKDRVWWVRYRAAQSLTRVPDISMDWINDLLDGLEDPYARDILQRVLVEENLA